jgi:hypothetical protein
MSEVGTIDPSVSSSGVASSMQMPEWRGGVMRSKRWDESSNRQRVMAMLLTALQISLAVSAWTDLARRKPHEVNGSKWRWAGIIAINFIGPLAYFAKGRRPTA